MLSGQSSAEDQSSQIITNREAEKVKKRNTGTWYNAFIYQRLSKGYKTHQDNTGKFKDISITSKVISVIKTKGISMCSLITSHYFQGLTWLFDRA